MADHPTKVLSTTRVSLLTTGTSFTRTSKLSIFDFVFTAHVVERLTSILLEYDYETSVISSELINIALNKLMNTIFPKTTVAAFKFSGNFAV